MKNKTLKWVGQALAVGLTAAVGTGTASAQTFTIGGITGTDGEVGFNLTIDSHTFSGQYAGDLVMTPTAAPFTVVNTVCADILGEVEINGGLPYTYTSESFAGKNGIDPTWGSNTGTTSSQAIQNAAYIFSKTEGFLTSGTVAQKAAVQLAVWAALYDSGNGWNQLGTGGYTGRFNVTGSNAGNTTAIADAIGWLNTYLPANSPQYFSGNIYVPTPTKQNGAIAQEMMGTPVPEPTTFLAGALLLLPFGASTLRFVRKNRAQ